MPARFYKFTFTSKTPMLMHADDIEKADVLSDWRKAPVNKPLSKPGDDRSPPWTWRTYLYGAFIDDELQVVLPTANIMSSLKYAGSQIVIKGNKTFKKLSQSGIAVTEEFCRLEVGMGWAKDAPIVDENYCMRLQMMANENESMKDVAVRHCEELGIKYGDHHPGYGLRPIMMSDIDAIPPMAKFRDQKYACQRLGFSLYMKRAPVGSAKHVRVRPRFEIWQTSGVFKVTEEAINEQVLLQMCEISGDQAGLSDWRPSSPKSPGPFGQFSVELEEVKS